MIPPARTIIARETNDNGINDLTARRTSPMKIAVIIGLYIDFIKEK